MQAKQLNERVLIVFYMLFSAAILPYSGLMAHETSHHGIEGLRFLAMAFHNIAAIVF